MSRLYLLPVNAPEEMVVEELERRLQQVLGWEIRRDVSLPIPVSAFNAVRNQYEALHLMRAIMEVLRNDAVRVLAITEEDLSIPMLTFVFGQAQLGGRIALMSLARLRSEYYGMPANNELLMIRTMKEALHELGHTFGLVHCPTPTCVMALANNIQQVDDKGVDFCGGCKVLFQDALKNTEMTAEKETR
jgi:archaemetzincin